MGRKVICDTETDGLLNTMTTLHCICALDIDTNERFSFYEGSPQGSPTSEEFKRFARGVDVWVGHNFLGFDRYVINHFCGVHIPWHHVRDTLVLSRLFNVDREGGHSMENFGRILKHPKQEHEDWSVFTPEMLSRCETDVELNRLMRLYLLNEGKHFSRKSIDLEHKTQYILGLMERTGFYLDERKAHDLLVTCTSRVNDIVSSLSDCMPPLPKGAKEPTVPRYNKKTGNLSPIGLKAIRDWNDVVAGPFTKIYWEEFNLDSPSQIVRRMEMAGWKPTEFNKPTDKMKERGQKRGTPKVCEENLNTLPDTAPTGCKRLAEYSMLQSRRELIDGWFKALGKDGRVHGTCISTGAITHRMAHRNPNMANIPSTESPLGVEARQCFTVASPDRCIVGCDASAIQLRGLAHYLNDPAYTEEVVNGDVHTKNMQLTGGMIKSRNNAKTFIYAWLLGAGKAKLGAIIGGTYSDGELLNTTFLTNLPALKRLKEVDTLAAAQRGYVTGLDGRRIPIKSHHFALSSYLQGYEAVIMKEFICRAFDRVIELGLDAKLVAVVHDETQWDCLKVHAEQLKAELLKIMEDVGVYFKSNCPTKGEAKIGNNWHETH